MLEGNPGRSDISASEKKLLQFVVRHFSVIAEKSSRKQQE
jgi:hypothetical protein